MALPSKIKNYQKRNKCKKCGDYKNIEEMYDGSAYETCYQCGQNGKCRNIEKGGFAFEYDDYQNDSLSNELVEFKEGRNKNSYLLNYIKTIVKQYYPMFTSAQSIVPIPPRKNSSREFHSPNKIGKTLEEECKGDFKDALCFNKKTKQQKDLSFDKKFKNVKGAISLETSISSDKVLIVDDVFTSGATVMEAAKVLKSNDVEPIYVFCIGRTEPYSTQKSPKDGWPS